MKGVELSKKFYFEIVNPILKKNFEFYENNHR
jgi:hypothetical protein